MNPFALVDTPFQYHFNTESVTFSERKRGSFVVDLAKWKAALYSDELLSSRRRELMWTPVKLNDGSGRPYGFGWEVGKVGKHRQVKHAGTMLGFRSQIVRLLDDHLTVVVLTNATQAMPEKIALGIATILGPDLKLQQPERMASTLSADVLDDYAGRYQLPGGRVLTVARRESKLTVSMALALPGLSEEIALLLRGVSRNVALLTAENKTRFFDEDEPRATYLFSTDVKGFVQLMIEDQNGKGGSRR